MGGAGAAAFTRVVAEAFQYAWLGEPSIPCSPQAVWMQVRERHLQLAERLLGRPYALAGRVLHGQKLARQLGTPTANVQLKRRKPPLRGVFLVSALHAGHRFHGVANIGQRPTVAGDGSPHLEVHLLEFAGDLYGQRLTVEFHHKLRDEQRFASLEALKSAIDADIAAARAHWHAQPLTKSLK